MIQQLQFWIYTQMNSKQGLEQILEHHVNSSIIHDSQKVKTIHGSTDEWINKVVLNTMEEGNGHIL